MGKTTAVPCILLAATCLAGCGSGPDPNIDPLSPPGARAARPPVREAPAPAAVLPDTARVTLEEAVALARSSRPGLRAATGRVDAAEAAARQAGAWRNPEAFLEAEGFGGDRPGFEQAEFTVGVAAGLDVFGRAGSRARTADAAYQAERARALGTGRSLERDVRLAFHEVLAARERVAVADMMLDISRDTHDALLRQVEAGKAASLRGLQADTALESARLRREDALARLEVATIRLSRLLDGGEAPGARTAAGTLRSDSPSLDPAALREELVDRHPDIADHLWAAEVEKRRADQIGRERWPELLLRLGYRNDAGADIRDWVGGVAVQLPLLDRREAAVDKARRLESAARDEAREAALRLLEDLERSVASMRSAGSLLQRYDTEVLPRSREALRLARLGYDEGKFGYLDLVEAQRSHVLSRAERSRALIELDRARTELEALLGRTLPLFPGKRGMIMHPRTVRFLLLATALLLVAGCGSEEPAVDTASSAGAAPAAVPASVTGHGVEDLCAAHSVPNDVCILCNPEARDQGRLWCRGHDRYEDRCWTCHPELEDPDRLYCQGHGLYEDECFYCHPELLHAADAGADSAPPSELFCVEHGVDEIECGICQPALADALEPGQGLKIRLPSLDAANKAGVTSAQVANGDRTRTLSVPGELRFNGNRLARITPQVGGVVREIHVDLGQRVAAGDALVVISSPDVAAARANLLRARAEAEAARELFEREESLHAQGVSSGQEVHEARARHVAAVSDERAAARTLLDLGLTERDLEALEANGAADSRLVLRAPLGGTLVDREVVVGDVISPGDRLLAVCDLDTLWLDLAVPAASAARLSTGSPVSVTPASLGREFLGAVTWISDQLDPHTRLVRVRAEFPNPDRVLKAGMYVQAEVRLGTLRGAIPVSRDTVHRFGGSPFVFVELEPDLFEVRRVTVAEADGDQPMITAGLRPEDRLVVAQSYVLKSEFQKSRLGAGCAH